MDRKTFIFLGRILDVFSKEISQSDTGAKIEMVQVEEIDVDSVPLTFFSLFLFAFDTRLPTNIKK